MEGMIKALTPDERIHIALFLSQQSSYVEVSLKRSRSGNGERNDPIMAAYTRNLKDADIQNLAAYLSTLQP